MCLAEVLFHLTSRTAAESSVEINVSPLKRSSGPFFISDRCFFADAIAHLGLPLSLNIVDADVLLHLPRFDVHLLGVAMETKGVGDLSDTPSFGPLMITPVFGRTSFSFRRGVISNLSATRLM